AGRCVYRARPARTARLRVVPPRGPDGAARRQAQAVLPPDGRRRRAAREIAGRAGQDGARPETEVADVMSARPPAAALLLLRVALGERLYEPIAGDIEEAWRARGGQSAAFFALAIAAIADCWWQRLRFINRGDGHMHALVQDLRYGMR